MYIELNRHKTLIINFLEETMNDTDGIISKCIYETGWNKSKNTNNFCRKFANTNTTEKLYDFILDWYKVKK